MALITALLQALAAIPALAKLVDTIVGEWGRIRKAKLDAALGDALARHDAAVDDVLREHNAGGGGQAGAASPVSTGGDSRPGVDERSLENGR